MEYVSARKRVLAMPRFYFFDNGVTRALAQTIFHPVAPGTSYYGECFEHLVVAERHGKSLVLARKDFPPGTQCYLLSQDEITREEQGVIFLPWHEFLRREFPNTMAPNASGL